MGYGQVVVVCIALYSLANLVCAAPIRSSTCESRHPLTHVTYENEDPRQRREAAGTTTPDYDEDEYEEYEDNTADRMRVWLENANAKLTKKNLITWGIVTVVVVTWCCFYCMIAECVCKECHRGCWRNIASWCDRMCRCRDGKYRHFCYAYEKMGLPKPTYEEYENMRDMYGIDSQIMDI